MRVHADQTCVDGYSCRQTGMTPALCRDDARCQKFTHDGKRSLPFTVGVAFAITACALCSALNIVARAPVAPMLLLGIVCGAFCIVALTIRWRTLAPRRTPLFAGNLFGLALSVAVAILSQSNDLAPGMALPPFSSASSGFSAEVLYGKARRAFTASDTPEVFPLSHMRSRPSPPRDRLDSQDEGIGHKLT